MIKTNDVSLDVIEHSLCSSGIAFLESHSGSRCHDLYTKWRRTHADHLVLLEKQLWGELWDVKAKFFDSCHELLSILRGPCNPDIEIAGGSRVAIIANSIDPYYLSDTQRRGSSATSKIL
jgi:hypothetical protein